MYYILYTPAINKPNQTENKIQNISHDRSTTINHCAPESTKIHINLIPCKKPKNNPLHRHRHRWQRRRPAECEICEYQNNYQKKKKKHVIEHCKLSIEPGRR